MDDTSKNQNCLCIGEDNLKKISKVSIIIPTFNRPELCKKTVQSILDLSLSNSLPRIEIEIIVADDGSELVNIPNFSKTDNIILTTNKKNLGKAKIRNLGVEKCTGEIIFFIDDDIIVKENIFIKHIKAYEKFEEVKSIVTNAQNINGDKKEVSKLNLFLNTRGINKYKDNDTILGKYLDTQVCSFDKDFFYRIGKFDENMGTYGWEDPEIGLRVEKNGGKLLFIKSNEIYHLYNKTIDLWSKQLVKGGRDFNQLLNKYPEYRKRFGPTFFNTVFPCFIFNPILFRMVKYLSRFIKYTPTFVSSLILRYIFTASVFSGYKTIKNDI